MKKKLLTMVSVTATVAPLMVAGAVAAAPANAYCQPMLSGAIVRWWEHAQCEGINVLTAVTGGNKGLYPSLPHLEDEISAAELGDNISMVYVYKNRNYGGCSSGFHGAGRIQNLRGMGFGTCPSDSMNDDIASMNLNKAS